MAKEKPLDAPSKKMEKPKTTMDFAFGKINYTLMFIGLALLLIGYTLMSGGGSKDPKIFNPEIFSFQHITLAPIVVILGYVVEIFAIVKKSKD